MRSLAPIWLTAVLAAALSGCGAVGPVGAVDPYGVDPYGGSAYEQSEMDYGSYSGGDSYDYDSGDYGSDGGSYPVASPSPSPSPTPMPIATPNGLTAHVMEVKESNALGLGSITARVEVVNPTDRRLSGVVRVLFTDHGDPTANALAKRVTLEPRQVKALVFKANAWRLDGAEATVETDEAASAGGSEVRSRS